MRYYGSLVNSSRHCMLIFVLDLVWTSKGRRSLYPSFWAHRKSRYPSDFTIVLHCGYKILGYTTFYSFFPFLGNTGVAVMLYDPRRSNIPKIERESQVLNLNIYLPLRPMILPKLLAEKLQKWLCRCLIGMFIFWYKDRYVFICLFCLMLYFALKMCHKCSVIPAFKSAAEELLNNSGLSVVDLFAKALAKAVVSHFSSSFSPFFSLQLF